MLYLFSSIAFAQDIISLSIIEHGQINATPPALILKINQPVDNFSAKISCGGITESIGPKSVSRGDIKIELPTKKGRHQCSGKLNIEMDDGTTGEMPLNFSVTMHEPLKMSVDRSMVDLENKNLVAKLSRPAAEYSISIIDPPSTEVGQGFLRVPQNSNLGAQTISWTDSEDDISVIRVTGKDIYGFYTEIDLLPWSYDIPHEDVIFDSNKFNINADQEYKLTDVKGEVQKVVDKYADIAVVNLYIAGYTDTVGNANSNLTLSAERAKSISLWFKASGFKGMIYYQGFGESALAVPTADGVNQAENRRVLYLVAADTPAVSPTLPKQNWKKLP